MPARSSPAPCGISDARSTSAGPRNCRVQTAAAAAACIAAMDCGRNRTTRNRCESSDRHRPHHRGRNRRSMDLCSVSQRDPAIAMAMTDEQLLEFLGVANETPENRAKILRSIPPERRALYDRMAQTEIELAPWELGLGPKPTGVLIDPVRKVRRSPKTRLAKMPT